MKNCDKNDYRGIAGQGALAITERLRQMAANWVSLGVVVGVLLLVCGWRIAVVMSRPPHLLDIAGEVGSVAEFWGQPVPANAGNKILFKESTETGVGLFWAKFSKNSEPQRKLLYDQAESDFNNSDFNIMGWSPDDSQFIFTRRPDSKSKREIVVCNGESGEISAVLSVDRAIKQLAWLTPQSFVYVDDYQDLFKIDKVSDGTWGRPQPFKRMVVQQKDTNSVKIKLTKEEKAKLKEEQKAKLKQEREKQRLVVRDNLLVLDANTIAYRQEQAIWSWGFGSEEPQMLWEVNSNSPLMSFDLDGKNSQLRLCLTNADGIALKWFSIPQKKYSWQEEVKASAYVVNHLEWFNGEGYGYRSMDNMIVKDTVKSPERIINFQGGINSYAGTAHDLYVVGSRSGEPTGIWKLAAEAGEPVCVVSNSTSSFKLAKPVAIQQEVITNSSGERITFRLMAPPHVRPGNKYPLLIGKMHGRWSSYPSAVANAGAYVVTFNDDSDDDGWGSNAREIIESLKPKLQMDPDNLYLVGVSGYTPNVNSMLESHQSTWKGAIFFSPAVLPNPKEIGASRIFIDYGAKDPLANQVDKFRSECAQAGVSVTVSRHENSGHIYRSIEAVRARDEAVIKFLFGL
jgi:predicted esterase